MTEDERKELVQKALEAKKKLEEELAATKKQVVQKEKELDKLQAQVIFIVIYLTSFLGFSFIYRKKYCMNYNITPNLQYK